jgi:hypothetical protein
MVSRSLILAFFTLYPALAAAAGQRAAPVPTREPIPLIVFLRGAALGSEFVTVTQAPDGWTVSSSGTLSPPLGLNLRTAELQYDPDWRPRSLSMQGTARDTGFDLRVKVTGNQAEIIYLQGTETTTRTDTLSPGAHLLPNNFFGAYVALAKQLVTAKAGASLRVYVAPQAEITATLDGVSPDRLKTPTRSFDVRRHQLTFQNPKGPLPVEVWTEEDGALVRVRFPSADLEVTREDVASIATRREKIAREGDEDVKVPANGFSLAATVSRPTPPADRPVPAKPKWPAIILVAGSGAMDRDEFVAGIPIFGQLAGALADAGYLVIRYDKRGVGQSGGRAESVTLGDHAEDVLSVCRYLSRRKDVDEDRITVVGHSEGSWVGLIAAAREKGIRQLVLSAAPATKGHELVLEQQKHVLELMKAPQNEADAKIAMQQRINSAVMSGTSWEGVPAAVRRQAETPWFASFLRFDPAAMMRDVRQPLLVVQGSLDTQVPPHHADTLAELANQRKKGRGVEVVRIDGVNHLFVPAATGEVSEYPTLPDKAITPRWPAAIVEWLAKLPPKS